MLCSRKKCYWLIKTRPSTVRPSRATAVPSSSPSRRPASPDHWWPPARRPGTARSPCERSGQLYCPPCLFSTFAGLAHRRRWTVRRHPVRATAGRPGRPTRRPWGSRRGSRPPAGRCTALTRSPERKQAHQRHLAAKLTRFILITGARLHLFVKTFSPEFPRCLKADRIAWISTFWENKFNFKSWMKISFLPQQNTLLQI